jgi:NitT/TauT family transport system substrate-binding protein
MGQHRDGSAGGAWRLAAAPLRSFTLAVLLCGFALSGARTAAAQPMPQLGFAGSVTWYGQVPIMVALDKGFFKAQGLDVTYQVILASGDRLASVTAGSSAFSNLGRTAVIPAMARGDTSFYYFANIDDSPGNEGCWARPGFAGFKDLRGHKVAANTSAQITMNGLLETQGMTEKDIQFANLPPNEMAPALANGDVDAACVWQPLLDGLKKAAPGGKLLGTDMDTPNYQKFKSQASPDIMVIARKLVDEHPDQARKLAIAIFQGVDFTLQHPDEAADTVAHYFHQSPEQVLAGMKSFRFYGTKDWQEHMKLHTAQMQFLAQWLYDNKKIASLPDAAKWENTSFIPAQ